MRVIDIEELKARAFDIGGLYDNGDRVHVLYRIDFVDFDELPTIDAVEVVRCKECVHSELEESPITGMWCTRFGQADMAVEEDDFCSFGERRDND